ncbi:MAG: tetratricopeptide repeat protein [Promethearchaeota archaeon]
MREREKVPRYVLQKFDTANDRDGPTITDFLSNIIMRLYSGTEAMIFFQGMLRVEQGMADLAIHIFDDWLLSNNKASDKKGKHMRATCLTGKGLALYSLGNYKDAIVTLEKAFKIDKRNAIATLFMGDCYSSLNLLNEALSWFEKTEEIKSKHEYEIAFIFPLDIRRRKAQVLAQNDMITEAVREMESLDAPGNMFGRDLQSMQFLASLHCKEGHWKKAIDELTHVFKNEPSIDCACMLMEACIMNNNLQQARKTAEHVRNFPRKSGGRAVLLDYLRAVLNALEGKIDDAIFTLLLIFRSNVPHEIAWDFKPLDNLIDEQVKGPLNGFLKIMNRWINNTCQKKDVEREFNESRYEDVHARPISFSSKSLTKKEAEKLARRIDEEIMCIPGTVDDEEFKMQCTFLGDNLEYKGIIAVNGNPVWLMIIEKSPRAIRHPEEAPGFEQSDTYHVLTEIERKVVDVWSRYRDILKGHGTLEMAGGISGKKEWLVKGGKNWTLSTIIPEDQRNVLEKMFGNPLE